MMKVEVLTPERQVLSSHGTEVVIPTADGILGVRTGHIPLIAPLKAGEIVIMHEKGEMPDYLAVAGGFVEILPDAVRIMADSADHVDDLDEDAINEAVARAEKAKAVAEDETQVADAVALIEMNLARLKTLKRRRAHGSHAPMNLE